MTAPGPPLAHSDRGRGSQTYADHAKAVGPTAEAHAAALAPFGRGVPDWFAPAVGDAGWFHDLGKLDPENQAVLRGERSGGLPVDHLDAGAAHLFAAGGGLAAWLVRSHHSPGLPDVPVERAKPADIRHRGSRHRERSPTEHREVIAGTTATLRGFLRRHEAAVGPRTIRRTGVPTNGLTLRLALSCLVDADHADTAAHDRGGPPPDPPETKWAERLAKLDAHVAGLPAGDDAGRHARRRAFYQACRRGDLHEGRIVACGGPVGIGKTLAVTARSLRHCDAENLRHLFVVAPFTNIVSQTVETLRKALTLPGEDPTAVVAEHHHRVDFASHAARESAATWKAPVVVTTAVQLFETLAGCTPAALRKLHELPGSAVFLDEAHAALPFTASRPPKGDPGGEPVRYSHWPRAWGWLRELADGWGCRVVPASGSLVRFWESPDLAARPAPLPELAPAAVGDAVRAEGDRVRYERIEEAMDADGLVARAAAEPGPRLVILNTVQSAAVVARAVRDAGGNVLHLSTALTPADREAILERIEARLNRSDDHGGPDWTLVATSCVEAGVDLSFAVGFREACSAASLIQTGGRVNRHAEYGGGTVFSFALADVPPLTRYPGFAHSARVLDDLFEAGGVNGRDPAEVVTEALERELKTRGGIGADRPTRDLLWKAEAARDYPEVARLGRVIDADTRIVVVDEALKTRLEDRTAARVPFRDLMRGSVQLWTTKLAALAMEPVTGPVVGYDDLYFWGAAYEPDFLGVMAGMLDVVDFAAAGGAVI